MGMAGIGGGGQQIAHLDRRGGGIHVAVGIAAQGNHEQLFTLFNGAGFYRLLLGLPVFLIDAMVLSESMHRAHLLSIYVSSQFR